MYSPLSFENLNSHFWDQFQRSACFPDTCPCEAFSDSIILQPINVITSVPSLFLGIFILFYFRWRIKALGISFILTGLGSILLHSSMTHIGQIADFSGIALIFTWILLHMTVKGNKRLFFKFILCTFILYTSLYYFIGLRYYIVFSLIICITLITFLKKPPIFFTHKPTSILSVLALVIGFILFRLDLNRIYCPSYTILQGHALWHILVFISEALLLRNIYIEEVNLQKRS